MYYYVGAPNSVFSTFAFVGFVISFIPLPWHLETWNVGTCLYMIWTGLACLVFFIDSIVWNGNIGNWSPTWCDMSTHFLNGFNLAVPACCLCINRRLYQIASVRIVTPTRADKRRAIAIDLAIGLGLPILQIPLQYIVQGHRYNIFQDIGCLGETFETPVAVALFHLPPILVSCVSAVYSALSTRSFYHSRAQLKELLSESDTPNLNLNRYVRLMLLASTNLLLSVPAGVWVLWVNVRIVGLRPWVSWAATHSHFSRVVSVPGFFWRADVYTATSLETTRWLTVGCAFLFFAFFGFADEAVRNYRGAFGAVARRLGFATATAEAGAGSVHLNYPPMRAAGGATTTLPVFVSREAWQKRDISDHSLSDMGLDDDDKEQSLTPAHLDYAKSDSFSSHSSNSSPVDEMQLTSFHLTSNPLSPTDAAHTV
ncbi:pheromone B alpha 1 receptor [Mycena filopes]|nr:pheromone B alpha 1 receptor [Mycena filopes]